jgi:tetratricopeptide (TPR) repeat protein
LITGCSSIYKSLECFYAIKKQLNKDLGNLEEKMEALKNAIVYKPERFDRGWKSKERYSMDWYYPILCGVITGKTGLERYQHKEKEFIVEGFGCKCVVEEPWVTIAESSELVIALARLGEINRAQEIFSWLHQWKDPEDNLYWTGYVYPDKAFWPIEKPTWTAAAVLLAADTLYKFTDASKLFLRDWSK